MGSSRGGGVAPSRIPNGSLRLRGNGGRSGGELAARLGLTRPFAVPLSNGPLLLLLGVLAALINLAKLRIWGCILVIKGR